MSASDSGGGGGNGGGGEAMAAEVSEEDVAFMVLIIFGVVMLTLGLVYILCRYALLDILSNND